ncbi:DNA polymerase III PolC-type-like [Mytilus trossulus]|uniref:DNA polymerase III PolC-type-like n=1 Tax=Mytilus trossulus TaxID=6551 RepID=UPI003005FC8B
MGPDGDHADIETIPDLSDLELPKTVVIDNNEELSVVVFDIETTGFGYDSEKVQLPAVCDKGEFDKYIIPTKPIHPKATKVTHLFSTGTRLYYKGQQLKTELKENVINSFIDWLPKNALLVAHNCKQFDAKILVSQMQPLASTFLENLKDHMLGFSDTLPLFRVKFPKRKSYSQSSLAKDILKTTYNAHNALDDVKILKQLIEVDITKEQLIENSFEVNEIERQLQMFNAKKHLLVSYNGVIREKEMKDN